MSAFLISPTQRFLLIQHTFISGWGDLWWREVDLKRNFGHVRNVNLTLPDFSRDVQGAHSLDMQRRGLLIQTLPMPPKSILQDKLVECGESGGGVRERGRGDRMGDGSETWEIQVINLRMRETRLCVEEQSVGGIINASSHTNHASYCLRHKQHYFCYNRLFFITVSHCFSKSLWLCICLDWY